MWHALNAIIFYVTFITRHNTWPVLCLQEFYGDYIAMSPHIFSINNVGCCQVSTLMHVSHKNSSSSWFFHASSSINYDMLALVSTMTC